MDRIGRREFLKLAGGTAALAGLAACSSSTSQGARPVKPAGRDVLALPAPDKAPFDHVVVVMMENRSFDHLLGWLPGADGKQTGLKYTDTTGAVVPTWDLGDNYQGCQWNDPQHQWAGGAKQLNGGKADGFLLTQPVGDHFPIGYYSRDAVPMLGSLAQHYTTYDRYFPALLAGTWPNRLYMHAAACDVDNTGLMINDVAHPASNIQTAIWDRLADKGISAGYYYEEEPFTSNFASRKYDHLRHKTEQFYADAKAGTLPQVSFFDPNYGGIAELTGTSNDYHPHGSIRSGEAFLRDAHDAIAKSPLWDRTVMVINFDEWGGFYDHVVPPTVRDNNVNPNPGPHPDYSQLGFRVPAMVVSPFSRTRVVHTGPYEHCSVLRMIEWRFGLEPLTERDRYARNIAETLDFSQTRAPMKLPTYDTPELVACAPGSKLN